MNTSFCGSSLGPKFGLACLYMMTENPVSSLERYFDFFEGVWNVRMRRRKLSPALQPISEWSTFDAAVRVERALNGTAFVEHIRMDAPEGIAYAVGSRFYNAKTNQWAIFWANENDYQWQKPMRGGLLTSSGIDFISDDVFEGRHVLARYRWNTLDRDHPAWEQAFSNDNGASWVANWMMGFRRHE